MSKKRRNHSAEFKSKVAIAAVKYDKTLTELAQQFDVHPNQITQWKQQLLTNVSQLFQKANGSQGTNDGRLKGFMRKWAAYAGAVRVFPLQINKLALYR